MSSIVRKMHVKNTKIMTVIQLMKALKQDHCSATRQPSQSLSQSVYPPHPFIYSSCQFPLLILYPLSILPFLKIFPFSPSASPYSLYILPVPSSLSFVSPIVRSHLGSAVGANSSRHERSPTLSLQRRHLLQVSSVDSTFITYIRNVSVF